MSLLQILIIKYLMNAELKEKLMRRRQITEGLIHPPCNNEHKQINQSSQQPEAKRQAREKSQFEGEKFVKGETSSVSIVETKEDQKEVSSECQMKREEPRSTGTTCYPINCEEKVNEPTKPEPDNEQSKTEKILGTSEDFMTTTNNKQDAVIEMQTPQSQKTVEEHNAFVETDHFTHEPEQISQSSPQIDKDIKQNKQQKEEKQDQFQSILTSQSKYNHSAIRQSYLPLEEDKSFSHALLKFNLAAHLKNHLLSKTNILMNSEIHIKRIGRNKGSFSFPSMSNKLRPKNFDRALYFDGSADVIPSFFRSSETRASKALAEVHCRELEEFKRKVKASKTQNGVVVLYDWGSDPLSLRPLQSKLAFVAADESWIFLNHARIKKAINKLQKVLEWSRNKHDQTKTQECKKNMKFLRDSAQCFFGLAPKERNNLRKEIERVIDSIGYD